ncbi:aminodeoxychorismate lyase [Rhodococcus sp. H29-C3]|uniref:aminodeoxychorismate lyase n=1 Tax=Rhodococcus sp. H29-C3 TaxID=3046307 RepID=UPI0024B89B8F|nr:aminodeoxychorismate lyase [Rhodococcus sp. H29-C3]MDJ0360212.1 aminodeoxychorismate lyase [Rhodococcus sp. H29-C3]
MSDRVVVTLDGQVHDADQPLLCADDLAAVRGDGIFETLLIRDGAACGVERHLTRLAASARALDLPEPDLDDWRLVIGLAVDEWERKTRNEGALRVVLSRGRESGGGPTGYATVGPLNERVAKARTEGVSAITLGRGYSVDFAAAAPWQLMGAKTLSYATNMAALRYAAQQGADEVIYTSNEGQVLEGPRSTVVISRGKTLITPPVEHGILAGTTVDALFDVATAKGYTCEKSNIFPADLIAAEGVWLISSITLAARVVTLNGVTLGTPESADDIRSMVDFAIERGEGDTVDA